MNSALKARSSEYNRGSLAPLDVLISIRVFVLTVVLLSEQTG